MHDYDEDLDGFLIENEEGRTFTNEGFEAWEPQNDADAEYALSMLRRAHTELERIQAAAERQRDRIKAYEDQASVGPLEDVAKWEQKLIGYRKRLERDDPDLKATYELPSGQIKRLAGRERVVVEDLELFCLWALDNDRTLLSFKPSLNNIKQRPNLQPITAKDALKKTARTSPTGAQSQIIDMATGEKLPGVKIEIGPPTYSARPS